MFDEGFPGADRTSGRGLQAAERGGSRRRCCAASDRLDAAYLLAGASVPTSPGPEIEAARWLSERRIFATGSDTITYEKVPSRMPVHVHLLVESGIHIIEVLDLEELARDGVWEFSFIALPLKIRGATGSPIRPVAIKG
jgi:kynurenine formamidase